MIELTDEAMEALKTSHKRYLRVDSYYGKKLLYNNVPFMTGSEESNSGVDVQERVEFTIPRIDQNGFDWSPKTALHPLAANGQRLHVVLGVGQSENEPDWFRRGVFRIYRTIVQGDLVKVEAVSLMWPISVADFTAPFQPSGTFDSTVRDLIGGEVSVVFDDSLVNRNIPSDLRLGTSRMQSLQQVLDAWPAEMAMHEHGYLLLRPLLGSRTPVLKLTHGFKGTIIESSGMSTSESPWNTVVVRGKNEDGTLVQGVARNISATHPRAIGTPFSNIDIPVYFDNDLIDNLQAARKSANAILARKMKKSANSYTVEMIPHPALQTGDVIEITTNEGKKLLVEVGELKLPYTHDGGTQTLTVREI